MVNPSLFHDLRTNSRRDRLACWICNFVLNHLASEWYRRMIEGCIRYGLTAARQDEALARARGLERATTPDPDTAPDFQVNDGFGI